MLLFFNRLVSFFVFILIIMASQLTFVAAIDAATQDFQWTGSTGYKVEGSMRYDKTLDNRLVSEKGVGKTNRLKSLKVKIYNPNDDIIGQYDNVVDGESQNEYLELNLDTKNKQILGNIDLGGTKPGELFLKGKVDEQLSLVKIETSGKEHLVDSDRAY